MEAPGAERGGEVLAQDLEGHLAVVLEVRGGVHGRHAARAELSLAVVAVRQCLLQPLEEFGHSGHVSLRHRQPGVALARASRTIGWNSMSALFQRSAKRR